MSFIKRIFLFAVMNIAVLVVLNIIIAIVQGVFGINITGNTGDYLGIAIFALVYGMAGSLISLQLSRWMAKRMYGKRMHMINQENMMQMPSEWQGVYQTVEQITTSEGLPLPEVAVYESSEVNAFATGPSKKRSLVAISTGLLDAMQKSEVDAVIAHEVAHIANGDMVTMTLLQGVLNAFVIFFARIATDLISGALDERMGFFARWAVYILLQIVLGFAASIVLAAFSRHREYHADAGSGRYVGREKMIAALQRLQSIKLDAQMKKDPMAAMKIFGIPGSIFATHPPLDKRIEALSKIG